MRFCSEAERLAGASSISAQVCSTARDEMGSGAYPTCGRSLQAFLAGRAEGGIGVSQRLRREPHRGQPQPGESCQTVPYEPAAQQGNQPTTNELVSDW